MKSIDEVIPVSARGEVIPVSARDEVIPVSGLLSPERSGVGRDEVIPVSARDEVIHEFLLKHLRSIQENDTQRYHETTSADLTLYEWWVTPHRLDGLPFHEFMMQSNARRGTVFGAEGEPAPTRFDLANLHIQRYADTAIASYTLLVSSATPAGVTVIAHNETRVIVKIDGSWKVAHVHKSPAYAAPHVA